MFSVRRPSIAVAAVIAAVGTTGIASADVVIDLVNQTYGAFQFGLAVPAGGLTGVLTGATINVTLDQSVAYTYADDLCVYLDSGELGPNGALQIGGFSSLFASQRYFWPTGNSSGLGTVSAGTVELVAPIVMTGSDLNVWIGNGYNVPGASGTWTGTITLHGVNVPAPGAIALLGLVGLAARRRR